MEVSLCVTVAQSYFPVARYSSTTSGVMPVPHSTSCLSAGTPLPSASSFHRLPKVPTENTMARRAVEHRMAPSMRPVPDKAENRTGCFVPARAWIFSVNRFCSAEYSEPRCPIMGWDMAFSTSGCTSVGPGMKSFLCAIRGILRSDKVCIFIQGTKKVSRDS